MNALIDEFHLLPVRLLGVDSELYSAYDRLRAEAEFRTSIILPLLGFAGALLADAPFYSILLVIGVVGLARYAYLKTEASKDVLFEALRAKRIEAAALDGFDQALETLENPKKEA